MAVFLLITSHFTLFPRPLSYKGAVYPDKLIRYEGDLEADYIGFLAKVQKAAKENPVDVEFDFP